jgi:hypothetical protein
MAWVCVYRASGATDGFLVGHWLDRNGIPNRVRDGLVGLRGEIPVDQTWPSVWVPREHAEAAAKQIASMNGPRLVREAWTCPRCGADGEPDFDTCWQCDGERP